MGDASPIFYQRLPAEYAHWETPSNLAFVLFDMVKIDRNDGFWATVCKTVCPMLSDRCLTVLSCLSVCNVGALWPNGWTDQDETWHAGMHGKRFALHAGMQGKILGGGTRKRP